jgi:hypothetical protein
MARDESLRINYVWIALCVLTVVSASVARLAVGGDLDPSKVLGLAVLAIGAVKARLILTEFMELKTAPGWLRLATDGWLVGTFLVIVVFYLR